MAPLGMEEKSKNNHPELTAKELRSLKRQARNWCEHHAHMNRLRTMNRQRKKAIDANVLLVLRGAQKDCCAGCGEYNPKLFVDHNHRTFKIRGLLCHRCNIILGWAKENPKTLRQLARYLDFYNRPVPTKMKAIEMDVAHKINRGDRFLVNPNI